MVKPLYQFLFFSQFFKVKFGIKTELAKFNVVKEEPVKIIELKANVVNDGKVKVSRNS